MQRVVFVLPSRIIPPVVLRRMLETNLAIARSLNVPLHILADASYMQSVEALLAASEHDLPVVVEQLKGQLRPKEMEQASEQDLFVVPGFGSRQVFMSSVGHLPERMAAAFDGNLAILHFDK